MLLFIGFIYSSQKAVFMGWGVMMRPVLEYIFVCAITLFDGPFKFMRELYIYNQPFHSCFYNTHVLWIKCLTNLFLCFNVSCSAIISLQFYAWIIVLLHTTFHHSLLPWIIYFHVPLNYIPISDNAHYHRPSYINTLYIHAPLTTEFNRMHPKCIMNDLMTLFYDGCTVECPI